MTTLTDDRGEERTVHTLVLFDAWMRIVSGADLGLPDDLTLFLSRSRMRRSDGEMLLAVRDECRASLRRETVA